MHITPNVLPLSHYIPLVLRIIALSTSIPCANHAWTQTSFHFSLHELSRRLVDASVSTPGPLPAAQRIEHRPLLQMLKTEWNTQVETLFRSAGDLNRKAIDWSKRTLYGGYVDSKEQ